MIKARANIPEPDGLYCSYCFNDVYECYECDTPFGKDEIIYCDDGNKHYCEYCYVEIKE